MQFFVITPHNADFAYQKKRQIVEKTSAAFGMKPIYAPVLPNSNEFDTNRTFDYMEKVDFFIADLSLERPSCYYEVGYAQALRKSVYLMAENGTEIHQVKNRDSIHLYKDLEEYCSCIQHFLQMEAESRLMAVRY